MRRSSCGLKAVLLSGVAAILFDAAASGALADPFPGTPLVIDDQPPPASPVVIDGSTIYSSVVIGQNNPDQEVNVTGNTLILSGLTIGENATSSGNQVTAVSGLIISTSIANPVIVGGAASNNVLTIGPGEGAGLLASSDLIIGRDAGATGNQLVVQNDDIVNGIIMNNAFTLYVGSGGSLNSMTVEDGGTLFSVVGVLGQQSGADGNVATVTGAGSLWQLDASLGGLIIGDDGNDNIVQVTEGGTLELLTTVSPETPDSAPDIVLGRDGGLGNQLYIADGGTVTHPGAIYIGENGSYNLLLIDEGGTLNDTYGILGYETTATANTAEIDYGGTWNINAEDGWLIAGLGGSDNLVNVNGGTINLSNPEGSQDTQHTPDIIIGGLGGSGNGLSIGYSGQVSHPDDIYVGENGTNNQLDVYFDADLATGGSAYIGGGPSFSAAVYDGVRSAADNNSATIDGTGTTWTIGGDLFIGAGFAPSSTGNQLTVSHGATVSVGGDVFLGFDAESDDNILSVSGRDNDGSPTAFTALGTIGVGVGAENDLESGDYTGNTLEVGGTTDEYFGTVTAANILIGSGNALLLGAGGVINTDTIQFGQMADYIVEIDSTAPAALNVSGTATQGGTVAMGFGTEFDNYYVILSSAEATGTFTLDTSNLAPGLTAELTSTETATGQDTAIAFVANFEGNPNLTGNELEVAISLDTAFNSGSSIPGELATIQPQDEAQASAGAPATLAAAPAAAPLPGPLQDVAKQRLSALTGEVGAGGGTEAVMQASRSFLSLVMENGGQMGDVPPPAGQDMEVWSSLFGASASLPGDGNAGSHETDVSVAGIAAGWQRALAGDRLVGLAIAGGATGWSLQGTSGEGDSSFLQLGAYGEQRAGNVRLAAAAGLAMHQMSTDRTVAIRRSHHYEADYASTDASLRLEAGYEAGLSAAAKLVPYAAFEAHHIVTGAHDEDTASGGGAFALSYDTETANLLRSEVGLGFALASPGEKPRVTFTGRAAWAHDWGGEDATVASFQAIDGASFAVVGAQAPDNVALLNATVSAWATDEIELTASATGEFGTGYDNLSGAVGLNLPF